MKPKAYYEGPETCDVALKLMGYTRVDDQYLNASLLKDDLNYWQEWDECYQDHFLKLLKASSHYQQFWVEKRLISDEWDIIQLFIRPDANPLHQVMRQVFTVEKPDIGSMIASQTNLDVDKLVSDYQKDQSK